MKYLLFLLPVLLAACASDNPHTEENKGKMQISFLEKFDRFDYNGDGFLTKKEIIQGMKETNATGTTPEQLDARFKFYDVNHDGKISHWEAEHALDKPIPANL
jgi:Ca2+-binding EF-hand superfamily protein